MRSWMAKRFSGVRARFMSPDLTDAPRWPQSYPQTTWKPLSLFDTTSAGTTLVNTGRHQFRMGSPPVREVFVVGVGMTHFTRHLDKSCAELARSAVQTALADAGLAAEAVQWVSYANTALASIEG